VAEIFQIRKPELIQRRNIFIFSRRKNIREEHFFEKMGPNKNGTGFFSRFKKEKKIKFPSASETLYEITRMDNLGRSS
jgi:hypothetical protein